LYEYLFKSEVPDDLGDAWLTDLNESSVAVLRDCVGCPLLAAAKPGDRFQFERLGCAKLLPQQRASQARMCVESGALGEGFVAGEFSLVGF
jgi:hypothetical protein